MRFVPQPWRQKVIGVPRALFWAAEFSRVVRRGRVKPRRRTTLLLIIIGYNLSIDTVFTLGGVLIRGHKSVERKRRGAAYFHFEFGSPSIRSRETCFAEVYDRVFVQRYRSCQSTPGVAGDGRSRILQTMRGTSRYTGSVKETYKVQGRQGRNLLETGSITVSEEND